MEVKASDLHSINIAYIIISSSIIYHHLLYTHHTMPDIVRKKTTHVVLHCCPTGMEALNIGTFELAGGGRLLHDKIATALNINKNDWIHSNLACVCRVGGRGNNKKVPVNVLLDLIASEGYELKLMAMCPFDNTKGEGLTYTFVKEEELTTEK